MTKHTNDGVKRLSLLILLSSIGFFATFCSAAASEACTSEEPPPKPYNPYEGGGHYTSSEKPVERLSLAPTYFAEIDSNDCSSSSATNFFRQAQEKVHRYIWSQTQVSKQEIFHPSLRYLEEAMTFMGDGLRVCNWNTCSMMCTNATIQYAVLLLKFQKFFPCASVLEGARSNLLTLQPTIPSDKMNFFKQQIARVIMMQGFTEEWKGDIDKSQEFHEEAKVFWPSIEKHYMGILRTPVPDNASRDEKMKLYFYGNQEQIIALTELMIAKEFYPEVLMDYPVLSDDEPQKFWKDKDSEHKLIKQLMSPFVQNVFSTMVNSLITNGHLGFGDGQSQRYYMYNDRAIRFFHMNTIDVVRKIVGKPNGKQVIPSYVYFGGYTPGAELEAHSDRLACEYTLSLLVDQYPAGTVWPLGIMRRSRDDMTPDNVGGAYPMPPESEIIWGTDQQPGDGFLILGRHKVHFRDGPAPEGTYTRAYFLHYVYEDFKGSLT